MQKKTRRYLPGEKRRRERACHDIGRQAIGRASMRSVISSEPAVCPHVVERPIMVHRWDDLTFLHWSFAPDVVQRLLPNSLTVETYDDRAWVGLVPFMMRVGTARVSSVPYMSRFCETNVRTYVTDRAGRSGIWFFSLDAARLGAVVTARTTYRLPYFWSRMRLERAGPTISYSCVRRWPGPRGARSDVAIEIGDAYTPDALNARDHWLTARWTLFSVRGTRARFARAFHEPWPLRRARVTSCRDELLAAAGLPPNHDEPIAHFSDGVAVRIGRPEQP
jgi:uncharacterized protein YqjF (DUF2071 family)